MPLTPFQKEVVRVIAGNRSPESHIAGGAAINRSDDAMRFSNDVDIFHDLVESVAISAKIDEESLSSAGYTVDWTLRTEGFLRADVRRGQNSVRLEWTTDSAFRFFPVQPDPDFGYCLHRADLATNKVLAMVGRTEIRDFLDVLQFDREYLGLGAILWAACGKDIGFTPQILLDQANRHSRYQQTDMDAETLARPVNLRELKQAWLDAKARAEAMFDRLPADEVGCLYLDDEDQPQTPDPEHPGFPGLRRHFGSVRGAWPRIY